MICNLDDKIDELVSSWRFSVLRNKAPRENEVERLKRFHNRLKLLIAEECDDTKRRKLRHVMPAINCIREQLLFLRRCLHSSNIYATSHYVSRMQAALTVIMKESFQDEYRKAAIMLGALDAVAEALILEVEYFGVVCNQENRCIRKLVASCLTNLTFGNSTCKRRLCAHPDFIKNIVKVIGESSYLAQVYAGLLRNLSWMADSEMSGALLPTVSVLARASVNALNCDETKCLCACLAALWNLASHSKENKKTLCDEPKFLESLIELMSTDPQQTALLESVTGIFKYAAMYLTAAGAENYLALNLRYKLIYCLVDLLDSPSFSVIGNGLGIMTQLLAKDQQLRLCLRMNQKAMQYLIHLRNSNREDIRNPIKAVLSYLDSAEVNELIDRPSSARHFSKLCSHQTSQLQHSHIPQSHSVQNGSQAFSGHIFAQQPFAHGLYPAEGMSSSYSGSATYLSHVLDSPRLLKLRSVKSNIANAAMEKSDSGILDNTVSSQKPFYSVDERFAPRPSFKAWKGFSTIPRQSSFESQRRFDNSEERAEAFGDSNENNVSIDDGDNKSIDPSYEIADSVRCTRCTSTQSLTSLLPAERSGWESVNNSASNSNHLSPISSTDLPDSPTECTPRTRMRKIVDVDIQSVKYAKEVGDCGDQEKIIEDIEKYKFGTDLIMDDSGDYSSFDGKFDFELLNQSIEAAMPQKEAYKDDILALMIEKAQPKPLNRFSQNSHARNAKILRNSDSCLKVEDDDFLMQSIASVLPKSECSERQLSNLKWKGRSHITSIARPSSCLRKYNHWNSSHETALNCSDSKVPLGDEYALHGLMKHEAEPEKIGASSIAFLNMALQTSSLVESASEKEDDHVNDDNFNESGNCGTMDYNTSYDVDQEMKAEELFIDCSLIEISHHKISVTSSSSPFKKLDGSGVSIEEKSSDLSHANHYVVYSCPYGGDEQHTIPHATTVYDQNGKIMCGDGHAAMVRESVASKCSSTSSSGKPVSRLQDFMQKNIPNIPRFSSKKQYGKLDTSTSSNSICSLESHPVSVEQVARDSFQAQFFPGTPCVKIPSDRSGYIHYCVDSISTPTQDSVTEDSCHDAAASSVSSTVESGKSEEFNKHSKTSNAVANKKSSFKQMLVTIV